MTEKTKSGLTEEEKERLAKAIEEAKGIENTIFVALVFLAQGYIKRFDCDMLMLGEKYKVRGYRIGENFRIDFIKAKGDEND